MEKEVKNGGGGAGRWPCEVSSNEVPVRWWKMRKRDVEGEGEGMGKKDQKGRMDLDLVLAALARVLGAWCFWCSCRLGRRYLTDGERYLPIGGMDGIDWRMAKMSSLSWAGWRW